MMRKQAAEALAERMAAEDPELYVIGVNRQVGIGFYVSARDLRTGNQFFITSPREWAARLAAGAPRE